MCICFLDPQGVEPLVVSVACGTNARAHLTQVSGQRGTCLLFNSSRKSCKRVACICKQPLIIIVYMASRLLDLFSRLSVPPFAGCSVVRFRSSVWFSCLAFSWGFIASQGRDVGVGFEDRIFESCSRPRNRYFPESSIFLHIRLIRVG